MSQFLKFYKTVFGKKEKIYFYLLILGSILNFFIEFLSLGLVLPLIGFLVNPIDFFNDLFNVFPGLTFVLNYIDISNPTFIYYFLFFFVFSFVIKNFYTVIFHYFQTSFCQLIEAKISLMIIKKYSYQRFDFYVNNTSSQLLSKLHNDVIHVSRNYTGA